MLINSQCPVKESFLKTRCSLQWNPIASSASNTVSEMQARFFRFFRCVRRPDLHFNCCVGSPFSNIWNPKESYLSYMWKRLLSFVQEQLFTSIFCLNYFWEERLIVVAHQVGKLGFFFNVPKKEGEEAARLSPFQISCRACLSWEWAGWLKRLVLSLHFPSLFFSFFLSPICQKLKCRVGYVEPQKVRSVCPP